MAVASTFDNALEYLQLVARARAGSHTAARWLFEQHQPHVLRAVRRRLPRRLRSQYDSVDLAQEVWTQFFTHTLRHYPVGSPREIDRLLWHMADCCTKQLIRRRNMRRHGGRHATHAWDSATVHREAQGQPAPGSSPSEAAIAAEEYQRLMAAHEERDRWIVLLRQQGLRYSDIAQKLGIAERTVRRVMARLIRATQP